MPLVDLGSIPQVALPFMNEDHRVEADLLNQVAEAIDALAGGRGEKSQVLARYDALLEHTEEHFERENQAMQRAGFPPYPVHRGEHDHVLAEMRQVRDAFEKTGALPPLQKYVKQAVPSWFVAHIESMDAVTAGFVTARGG